MDIVTSPGPLNVPGANSVELRGYDLQSPNVTLATTDATVNNGSFTVNGNVVTYVPSGFFSDSPRLDPASGEYYDLIYARVSDGVNASPFITVPVLSFSADSYSEGIPDSWRTIYFGNPNPAVGAKHHASDDADGDGYSNLVEYRLGSNPTDRNSNLRITSFNGTSLQFQAKPYEVYEVEGSTDLVNWSRIINPVAPTNAPGSVSGLSDSGAKGFFRVLKVQ
jgi:hypothetical protein